MTDFATAIGLALAIEGILYAVFPDAMKRMLEQVMAQPIQTLRMVGLITATFGVSIIWMIRG